MKKIKSMLQEFSSLYKLIFSVDNKIIPLAIITAIVSTSLNYISILYGALILDGLVKKIPYETVNSYVIQMVIISGILLILKNILNVFYNQRRFLMYKSYENKLARKHMDMDYVQLESLEVKQKLQEIRESVNLSGGIINIAELTSSMVSGFASLIYSIFLIGSIFVINKDVTTTPLLNLLFNYPTLSIVLLGSLISCVIFNTKLVKKFQKDLNEFYEDVVDGNRIFHHYFAMTSNYQLGKTFRIYQSSDLIMKRMEDYENIHFVAMNKFAKKSGKFSIKQNLISGFLMVLAYLYIGIKAMLGYISMGSIVSSVSAVTLLFTSIKALLEAISNTAHGRIYMKKLYEYLNMPSEIYHGTLPIEKRDDNMFELEFKNVSFKYPNTENLVLKNVSFKIKVGEKLAIVGPNGAGKSTFIKLLTRLYDPTEGEITLNGIDIKKYDYDEYISLMSVVFQDFKLFSLSLRENVGVMDTNDDLIKKVLFDAGFEERFNTLEEGLDTQLYQYNTKGVEISGGEAQKIAIARALYKDSPIVILDEPTAALDPISEAEIYNKFDTLVDGKTAIYISHRMSSCIFCDRILVFDNGQIVEIGSHQELLSKKGLYSEMWNAQAQYYN